MTEFLLSPAEKRDLPEMARIEKDAFPDPWSENAFSESLGQPFTVINTAKSGDRLVGYAVAYISFEEAEITRVSVDAAYRKKGAGRMLLLDLLDRCRGAGVRDFILEVRSGNEAAIGLYEATGFEKIGVRRDFYTKPKEDAVIMRLKE